MTGSASEPEDDADARGSGAGTTQPSRGGGLAGSFADRIAVGSAGSGVEPAPQFGAPEPEVEEEDRPFLLDDAPVSPGRAPTQPITRPMVRPSDRAAALPVARDRAARSDEAPETSGPAWERPIRHEAYPSLRTRVGLPSFSPSPVLVSLGAVLLAAVALFFLPALLGIGHTPAGTSGPNGSPAASGAAASPTTPEITPVPEPTAQIYLVQAGDTMSKIANHFGVPLQVLVDANKATIPNPDVLGLGQQVIIPPVAPTSLPDSPVVTEVPSTQP
jgi:hypothetical protein